MDSLYNNKRELLVPFGLSTSNVAKGEWYVLRCSIANDKDNTYPWAIPLSRKCRNNYFLKANNHRMEWVLLNNQSQSKQIVRYSKNARLACRNQHRANYSTNNTQYHNSNTGHLDRLPYWKSSRGTYTPHAN